MTFPLKTQSDVHIFTNLALKTVLKLKNKRLPVRGDLGHGYGKVFRKVQYGGSLFGWVPSMGITRRGPVREVEGAGHCRGVPL